MTELFLGMYLEEVLTFIGLSKYVKHTFFLSYLMVIIGIIQIYLIIKIYKKYYKTEH